MPTSGQISTASIDAMLEGMTRLQLIQAEKISLCSTTIGGRSIVGDYFSYQRQLEVRIRQGQEQVSFSYRQRYLGADGKVNKINGYRVFGRDSSNTGGRAAWTRIRFFTT
jgi:hypothetical protein